MAHPALCGGLPSLQVTGSRGERATAADSQAVSSHQWCLLAMSQGKRSFYWSNQYEMAFQVGDLIYLASASHMRWRKEGYFLASHWIMHSTTRFLLALGKKWQSELRELRGLAQDQCVGGAEGIVHIAWDSQSNKHCLGHSSSHCLV